MEKTPEQHTDVTLHAPSRKAFYLANLGVPMLLAGVVFLLFDLTQLNRLISNLWSGGHSMSHTFWAGIFVWLSSWLTALFFYGRLALQAPAWRRPKLLPIINVSAMPASLRPE